MKAARDTETNADNQAAEIDHAISFLQLLRAAGPWTVCAIDPEKGGAPETITFNGKREVGQMRAWINARYGKKNLYFIANPTKRRMHKKPLESRHRLLPIRPCGL